MKYREFRWGLLFVLCFTFCFCACSKDDDSGVLGVDGPEVPEFQPSAYPLNIVYFAPSNIPPFEDYQERLSEIMFWIQNFYRESMIRNGFGNRTFGLTMETDKLVKITLITGLYEATHYPYEGGGAIAKGEIDTYFRAHPEEKKSEHVLVIMPNTRKNNMDPSGTPFYGLGTYCFAQDYRYFDIKYVGLPTDEGVLFTKMFGGLAHELGHCLNLPHNSQHVSEDKTLGTSLMGSGNYTLGLKPTFLTQASCGILDNCQVFSPVKKDFYVPRDAIHAKAIHIKFEEECIRVNGSFNLKDETITGATIYFDNLPAGPANNDYDAESWYVKPIGTDSLSLDIPWKELHRRYKDFAIRIRLLFPDGGRYEFKYEFLYKNGKLEDLIENY